MKKFTLIGLCLSIVLTSAQAQNADTTKKAETEKNALKFNINSNGSHYFQATFLNQTWIRYNESNPGSSLFQKSVPTTFDIGLRRTRIQLFGQINDRTFIYFQFGQNNFNNTAGYGTVTSNRKIAPFFHDALCELKLSKGNQLKLGGGLTVLNGLSRFSQPSIGTIMTLDVPVFLQYSVDQIDQFDRRLAVYARGQISKIDYRVYVSNPFPVITNGVTSTSTGISTSATFVNPSRFQEGKGPGINNQYGGYIVWNIFENEGHTTPYMTGTYLGSKKIFNVAAGAVYQKMATWRLSKDAAGNYKDTTYENMLHFSLESFLDLPLNKDKGTALSAFAGYYNTNYGKNYLRYNGIMNPSTGLLPAAAGSNTTALSGSQGNAIPMFGTGQVLYTQLGYLLPKKLLGENNGQLMPYASAQYADYTALHNKGMLLFDIGCNWLISGHKSKISIDYQNRPTYYNDLTANTVKQGARKGCITLQYQIFF